MAISLAGHPLELLSVPNFAKAAGGSVAQIQCLIDAGQLRHFRFGDQKQVVRVLRLDLQKAVALLRDLG